MRRGAVALGFALALLAWPAGAQELALPRDEARALAVAAARAGDWEVARSLAAGLVAADARDRTALMVLARALPQLGEAGAARRAGARAWRLSQNRAQRYEAARLTALAAAEQGNFWLAGLWLRLAFAAAPDPAEAVATRDEAAALRRLQRWRTELSFSVAPSSNVNGGATSADNVIDGFGDAGELSADAQALSGWVAAAQVASTYRLRESEAARTRLAFRIGGRGVLLSDAAQAALDADPEPPGANRDEVTAEDFSDAFVEIGIEHDRFVGPGILSLSADLGRRWPGGEATYHAVAVSGSYALPLGERMGLRFGGSHEWRDRPDLEELERALSLSVGLSRTWSSGAQSLVQLSYRTTDSERGSRRGDSRGILVQHSLARPVGPARLSVSAGYEVADYPDAVVGLTPFPLYGHRDERISAGIAAALPGLGWAGFEPVVRLDAARTDSDVSRFETESLGVGFEIRSSF